MRVARLLVALAVVSVILEAIGDAVVGVLGPVSFLAPLVLTVFGTLASVFLLIAVAWAYDHQTTESARSATD